MQRLEESRMLFQNLRHPEKLKKKKHHRLKKLKWSYLTALV